MNRRSKKNNIVKCPNKTVDGKCVYTLKSVQKIINIYKRYMKDEEVDDADRQWLEKLEEKITNYDIEKAVGKMPINKLVAISAAIWSQSMVGGNIQDTQQKLDELMSAISKKKEQKHHRKFEDNLLKFFAHNYSKKMDMPTMLGIISTYINGVPTTTHTRSSFGISYIKRTSSRRTSSRRTSSRLSPKDRYIEELKTQLKDCMKKIHSGRSGGRKRRSIGGYRMIRSRSRSRSSF
jgi:hypothetical protein